MSRSISIHGLNISVENPKGSLRSGVGPGGSWQSELRHDYGDIANISRPGADGDPVDVFVGDNHHSVTGYVVNQVNPDGAFDEHKVMLGFDSEDEAKSAYLANYETGWTGMGSVAAMPIGALMRWLYTGDLSQPVLSSPEAPASPEVPEVLTDALLVGPGGAGRVGYKVLTDASIADGFRRVKILAVAANVPNENGRYYTREFLRTCCDAGNTYIKASPRYGEEPHPRYNQETGQFDTDSAREVWRMAAWLTDAAGDLWAEVDVDTATAKGQRVNTKIDRGEKLGVSVRWNWQGLIRAGKDLSAIPKARLTDGTQVRQLFDQRMKDFVFPAVLDSVPNPAATVAGRVMLDAAEMTPMTDATQALPPVDLVPEQSVPWQQSVSWQGGLPENNAVPENTATSAAHLSTRTPDSAQFTKEKRPLKTAAELRAQAQTIEDPAAKQSLLDAAQTLEDAQQAAPNPAKIKQEILDSLAPELAGVKKAGQMVDAAEARAQEEQDRAKVQQLVDAVENGSAAEVTRFTDAEIRRELAESVRRAKTVEEGHAALLDAIALTDRINAQVSLRLKGMPQGQGQATTDDGRRTQVIADEGDKKISEVEGRLLDAIDRATVRLGGTVDKKLYARNKHFADRVVATVFGKVSEQAMVDSANYLLAPRDGKSSTHARRSMQSLVDAGFLPQDFTLTDAAVNTGNLLQQPLVTRIILQRFYQMPQALSFMSGFDPSMGGADQNGFTGGRVGGTYNLGRNFRFQTRYFVNPPHSTGGMSRKSLYVSEGSGISQSGLNNQWQTFHTNPRRLSFSLTRDVQVAVQTGTVPYDLVGTSMAENLAFFARETDQGGYLEMVANSLEINCLPATLETVVAGNIANGNVQDGLVYGTGAAGNAAVAAVVQIAPVNNGMNFVSGATPIQTAGATTSVSSAFRTPIVMPRDQVGVGDSGVETVTTLFPIIVKVGATQLVQGVLNADKEIIPENSGNPALPPGTPDFAVDYVRGKILFTAHSGVTNATTTLTLSYYFATNFYLTQINFAGGTYPNGQTDKEFFDTIYHNNDAVWAQMGSYPNFLEPNICLGSLKASRRLTEAQLFDRLRLPTDTELINPTGSMFASRHGIEYHQFNAPSILGDDALLLMRNETSCFAIDDPLGVEGGFTGYDPSGNLTGVSLYKMQQFDTFCTPMGRSATNAVFNPPSKLHILW